MRKKQNCFLFFLKKRLQIVLLFSIQFSIGQEVDLFSSIIASDIEKEERIHQLDSLLSIFEIKKSDSLHYIYQNYAYWLYDVYERPRAAQFEKKALEFAQSRKIKDTSFIQKSALYLGFYYAEIDEYLNSIDAYQTAILIEPDSKRVPVIYNKIAYAYLQINDYTKAIDYADIVINLLNKEKILTEQQLKTLQETYHNGALACFPIKKATYFIKGENYFRKADSLASYIHIPLSELYIIQRRIANINTEIDYFHPEIAFDHYTNALNIAKKLKDSFKIAETYIGLGDLYNISDKDKSLAYLEKALKYTSENDSILRYSLYLNKGFTLSIHNEHNNGLNYMHRGFFYLLEDNLRNPDNFDKKKLIGITISDLYKSLAQLGETYLKYYKETSTKDFLDKSIAYYKLSDYFIDVLKVQNKEFKSRLFWRELSTRIYSNAIKAAYLSSNMEDAFFFMEKNKSLLLLEDIAQEKYKRAIQLPSSVTQKEEVYKKHIVAIEQALFNIDTQQSNTIDSLNKQLIDTKIRLSKLEDSISVKTKDFKIDPAIVDLDTIKRNMTDDEIKIEYHISYGDGYGIYSNKENGYVLMISKDQTELIEIPNLSNLKEKISALRQSFEQPFQTARDITTFNELSYEVYTKLFPTEEMRSLIKGKKLTIIPDSYLSLLPFEALSTSPTSTSYLIKDAEISYQYSFSFQENTKSIPQKRMHTLLGVAPIHFQQNGLTSLSNSAAEIQNITNYFSGNLLLDKEATKEQFLTELPNHSIIHLATHANTEDTFSPWIAFYDDNISLEELYLIENSASLVVLSACNTTVGKQEIGEGVMSLARGFFYSGTQSVVSSLWNIDDQSTSEITTTFYKNLSEGESKSKALHNAKLSYLANHSLEETSPHYWASLILLGENDTLPSSSPYGFIYLLIGGLCVLAIIYLINTQFRSKI